jgi:transposase
VFLSCKADKAGQEKFLRMIEEKLAENSRETAVYYADRTVKAFLKTSKVQIIFLPPYSPNLNLIERLWRFLKKIVLYNRYYERFADFKGAILRFFANIKQYRLRAKVSQDP